MKNILFLFVLFVVGCTCNNGDKDEFVLTATWNGNSESDLAGYSLHYGLKSRAYDNEIRIAAPDTSVVIKGLDSTLTYYFALTAFDTAGNESAFSKEMVWPPHDFTAVDTMFLPDSPAFNISVGASKSNDPLDGRRTLAFWGNNNEQKALVKFDVDLTGTFDLEFQARGEQALDEWPILQIAVGDTQNVINEIVVNSDTYQIFQQSVQLRGLPIYLMFYNDTYLESRYDRNLFIASMRIKNPQTRMLIF